jgi:hypothetical protein
MKFEVFERLNTGGLALNAQEIRHAIYGGPLNDLLKELERVEAFRLCLGTAKPRRRMVDRELVLRFLALRERLDSYRPPLVRYLNEYMEDHRQASKGWLGQRDAEFRATTELIAAVLGEGAFRVIDSAGDPIERNVNRALFDAQMLVFSVADHGVARNRRRQVLRELAALFDDEDFNDAIRRATGDRSRAIERTRDVGQALDRAGVPVDLSLLGKSLQA